MTQQYDFPFDPEQEFKLTPEPLTPKPMEAVMTEQQRKGGHAVIITDGFGHHETEISEFEVSEPGPYAQYDKSVMISYTEMPRGRCRGARCSIRIQSDNRKYCRIRTGDKIVYDSRLDVPHDPEKRWPTREQWAEQVRTCYGDLFDNLKVDFELLPEECEAAIKALRAEWLRLGKIARANKKNHPEAFQLQGETGRQYTHRLLAMSDEQRDQLGVLREPQWDRESVNKAIKCLADGHLPTLYDEGTRLEVVKQAIRIPQERYERAREAAYKKREAEILATPIDDAAWEDELERRRDLEQYGGIHIR